MSEPWKRYIYRGVTLDGYTIDRLRRAERAAGVHPVPIYQGSYSTKVAASEGTHRGGGVLDLNINGLSQAQQRTLLASMRRAGFAAWIRTPAEGPWPLHLHAVAIGDKYLSPEAARQTGRPQTDPNLPSETYAPQQPVDEIDPHDFSDVPDDPAFDEESVGIGAAVAKVLGLSPLEGMKVAGHVYTARMRVETPLGVDEQETDGNLV